VDVYLPHHVRAGGTAAPSRERRAGVARPVSPAPDSGFYFDMFRGNG
jgi:hypothetical protein